MFNPADITFNPEQIKSISEAIFIDGFKNPDFEKLSTVVTGIIVDKQIAIMGRMNGLLGANRGGCNPNANAQSFTTVEKFWNPKVISDRVPICANDLEGSIIAYSIRTGIDRADMTGTDYMNFCAELVTEALIEMVYRFAWFGDVNADTIANAGLLTNGTNILLFNAINGFFNQMDAIILATPVRLTTGIDTKNSQLTYALQRFDSTDTSNLVVTNTLQNMRYEADLRLRNKNNIHYVVTQSVFDQYERELKFANSAFTTERLENGISILNSGGIEVIAFHLLDRIIDGYYNDGARWHLPHRAILTTPDNLQIGVADSSTLNTLDIFFDKKDQVNYIDVAVKMDSKVVIDHEVQIAW